jgi:hypothetical protein
MYSESAKLLTWHDSCICSIGANNVRLESAKLLWPRLCMAQFGICEAMLARCLQMQYRCHKKNMESAKLCWHDVCRCNIGAIKKIWNLRSYVGTILASNIVAWCNIVALHNNCGLQWVRDYEYLQGAILRYAIAVCNFNALCNRILRDFNRLRGAICRVQYNCNMVERDFKELHGGTGTDFA